MGEQDDLDVPLQEKAAAAALELQESLKLDLDAAVALVEDGLVALRQRQIVNPTTVYNHGQWLVWNCVHSCIVPF